MLAVLIAAALASHIIADGAQATTTTFNNAIHDEPAVECGHGTITVKVKTATQKPSYIFAKGHFHKDNCHFKETNNATFHFEQCNINRKREVNPRGMAYSLTVIVQLHPIYFSETP
ncbi:unnamed protein product [Gongylonema pulchrum]|uniref:ZP domain-containing protein n=1 Tax=Gongylonema pulchrum TaxID=637853 RepID=A0A183DXJ9_9BILA|nr:unnamed protein product [Gongylonema pulchrum]